MSGSLPVSQLVQATSKHYLTLVSIPAISTHCIQMSISLYTSSSFAAGQDWKLSLRMGGDALITAVQLDQDSYGVLLWPFLSSRNRMSWWVGSTSRSCNTRDKDDCSSVVLSWRPGAARTVSCLNIKLNLQLECSSISHLQLVCCGFDLVHMVVHFSVSDARILHVRLNNTAQELRNEHCNNAFTTGTPCVVCKLRSAAQLWMESTRTRPVSWQCESAILPSFPCFKTVIYIAHCMQH